ncbi:hypothetical protein Egran_03658 [Elaphomyces granulatus]|uniref:Uncharacterized protein n=1 Tax=Elaphomyces granulatus TaxID=519963 RepID=A0A232LWM5_9EURO|nr:hypothetical protein Egran_03658 [Elaphomyces granulatus]
MGDWTPKDLYPTNFNYPLGPSRNPYSTPGGPRQGYPMLRSPYASTASNSANMVSQEYSGLDKSLNDKPSFPYQFKDLEGRYPYLNNINFPASENDLAPPK